MRSLVVAPVATDRLVLRPWREDDLDALHEIRCDVEVIRYLPWELGTREDSRAWLAQRIAQDRLAADGDAVSYAVERTEDGRLVGAVNAWWRSVADGEGEIGFVLASDAQRKGYALEAVTALVDLLFDALDLRRVTGTADARNASSLDLMRRLGMRHAADADGGLVVWAVLSPEWEQRH